MCLSKNLGVKPRYFVTGNKGAMITSVDGETPASALSLRFLLETIVVPGISVSSDYAGSRLNVLQLIHTILVP